LLDIEVIGVRHSSGFPRSSISLLTAGGTLSCYFTTENFIRVVGYFRIELSRIFKASYFSVYVLHKGVLFSDVSVETLLRFIGNIFVDDDEFFISKYFR
jgi:hypothetical protein